MFDSNLDFLNVLDAISMKIGMCNAGKPCSNKFHIFKFENLVIKKIQKQKFRRQKSR